MFYYINVMELLRFIRKNTCHIVADFENEAETIVPDRAVIFGIEYDSMEDELIVE